jgi:histidyl-tRNA synthetase
MGSISGGGRYDNLTGMFGLPDVSGVGFSFGVDRIYDVMEELQLFPTDQQTTTKVLIATFDEDAEKFALKLLQQLRQAGINSELYPESSKIKKQMSYADSKNIPFVVLIGSEEVSTQLLTLKNMTTGEQQKMTIDQVIDFLK